MLILKLKMIELENLVKNIRRKITAVTLAGTLLLSPGCDTYKTISQNLIQSVTPIEIPIKRSIDYSKLTWQEAIGYVQTPEQAQDYLDNYLQQFREGRYDSFKVNHTDRKALCLGYAIAAAALLSDNGYPATILELDPAREMDHAVFLYKSEGKFFALGNTPLTKGYRSISDLAKGFQEEHNFNFKTFIIFNLNENYGNQWLNGEEPINTKRISGSNQIR
jgi:hypothetical protein